MFLTIFCDILNIHIFDDWNAKGNKIVRHCTVCNKEQEKPPKLVVNEEIQK